jgi:hypothetical protein
MMDKIGMLTDGGQNICITYLSVNSHALAKMNNMRSVLMRKNNFGRSPVT